MPVLETDALTLLVVAVLAYGLGSVAFGLIFSRVFGLGDVRKIGSGNIGATNVLRTGNKLAAFLTLLFDGGKGLVAVLIAKATVGADAAQVAGLAAFLGHLYPIWLSFRGGKGVATFIGVVLAVSFWVGVGVCLAWLATAAIKRMSSLAALVAAVASPVIALVLGHVTIIGLLIVLAAFVFLRHRENIGRIMAGTESRIGDKSK